jgi:ATP-dependent DNA helicase HFM1/MER3
MTVSQALKNVGVDSFESLAAADARKLESATGRNYPFGNQIKESLSALPPKIDIQIEDVGNRQGKSTIIVTLSRQSLALRSSKQNYADMVHLLSLFFYHPMVLKPTNC